MLECLLSVILRQREFDECCAVIEFCDRFGIPACSFSGAREAELRVRTCLEIHGCECGSSESERSRIDNQLERSRQERFLRIENRDERYAEENAEGHRR